MFCLIGRRVVVGCVHEEEVLEWGVWIYAISCLDLWELG